VLDAAGATARRDEAPREDRGRADRGPRDRNRRRRRSAEQPVQSTASNTAASEAVAAVTTAAVAPPSQAPAPEPTSNQAAAPAQGEHRRLDTPTQPMPFEPLPAPEVPVEASEPPRRKSVTSLPPMDEIDTGWDLGEADPTAAKEETATPSSSEMAGDGSTGGDGIDEPGWD
jgi:hypothetical protein